MICAAIRHRRAHVRRGTGNDRSRNKRIGRKPADLQTEHFSQYAEWNGGWEREGTHRGDYRRSDASSQDCAVSAQGRDHRLDLPECN